MKAVILLSLFALAAAEDYYFNGHDDLDNNAVVSEWKKELQDFAACLLDEAPCSEASEDSKRQFLNSIKTACRTCTPDQAHIIKIVIQEIKTDFPQVYRNLRRYYDPENKYFDEFERQVVNY